MGDDGLRRIFNVSIFPIIVLLVILYFVFGKNNLRWSGSDGGDTPLELLKKRYAKGEITKEEYDEIKKDL